MKIQHVMPIAIGTIRQLRNKLFTYEKYHLMAHVAGIRFEKDNQGVKRYIRIDLKKYGKEIEPFLQKLNIDNDEQFEYDWEQSLTPDQFKSQMHIRIKKWFDKKTTLTITGI